MKIIYVLAAMLLALLSTGCTEYANRTKMQQAASQEIRVNNTAHAAGKLPILTQASSTATVGVPQSSISMLQAPNSSNWCTENPSQPAIPAEQTATGSNFEQQVLQLVNKNRTSMGQPALVMDNNLSKMALVKAQDMYDNNYFDHNSPTYGSPFNMMDSFQITYSSAGENIAKGQTSAEQVMNDWMNSPGHRANILNSGFTKIGIGHYNGAWVQEFIS
ncbi:CAP domain-containing protein [Paenibacillus agricola]|uniref:SCP-like extracellular n=1 Tax=Paenibacillus agricola TaxID=2716264 RepID=A0ABX0J6R7_9BACL|nr:CAP domain-containing protein [Paenibacillus agricola]NHN30523.1 SCP-like extracellular [Paenibacillus agricola]